jgi:TPR repeat protein
MKRYALILVTLLSLLIPVQGWGANFQKGLDAYNSGDYATALKEWAPLAEQGQAKAQSNLGLMYNIGQGVLQDYKKAVKWYILSAEQGQATAQSNLGILYENGQGVLQDYKTAVKWYTLSAEQGYASAQSNLGNMYATGQGVLKDEVYAHMWWNIAASNGKGEAQSNRDKVVEKMTPSQIEKAQQLARECVAKEYKGC